MKTNVKVTKTQKPSFTKNLQKMTSHRISSMRVIDKEGSIKLLFDKPSRNYVVFNHYDLSSHYSCDFYLAKRFFNRWISFLNP